MRDSLSAILVLSYFLCLDFPELLVCDGGNFGEMHTTKIVFVADTSRFFANVTELDIREKLSHGGLSLYWR